MPIIKVTVTIDDKDQISVEAHESTTRQQMITVANRLMAIAPKWSRPKHAKPSVQKIVATNEQRSERNASAEADPSKIPRKKAASKRQEKT